MEQHAKTREPSVSSTGFSCRPKPGKLVLDKASLAYWVPRVNLTKFIHSAPMREEDPVILFMPMLPTGGAIVNLAQFFSAAGAFLTGIASLLVALRALGRRK